EPLAPSEALSREYIPFIDDITSSAVQLLSEVDADTAGNLRLHGLMLYPGVDRNLQPVWMLAAPAGYAETLHQVFFRQFTQNRYDFNGQTIYKLHINDRIVFASQLHDLLLLSESSLAAEDAVRSYLGLIPAVELGEGPPKGPSLVLNTPSLDQWISQLAKVEFRPSIIGGFAGTGPAVLQVQKSSPEGNSNELVFSGAVPLQDNQRSVLVDAIASDNAEITLDRYISSNASSFAIMRLAPRMVPPDSVTNPTSLDSLLIAEQSLFAEIAGTLNPEFSLVTYAESGFLSTGEHLYLRRLSDRSRFVNALNRLAEQGLLQPADDSYFAQSRVLGDLIGSELAKYSDFYINVTGEVVVISKRKGLAEVVQSDRTRRRVIYYDQDYMEIRQSLPDRVSGYIFANTDFYDFISSYLAPENYLNAITSKFNQLAITLQRNEEGNQLSFNMRTYTREETDIPYEEQWFFPTGGAELSGEPALADIRGSARDEIIFATTSGTVYALASDGTTVMQVSTGEDQPVGSPIVYDWYGTNQQVILLAAGNKVYGWNDTGTPLPKFPFALTETITAPLSIADVDQNGLPEAVVAAADRRLHVLDGRGNNIAGWPVTTNAPITSQPYTGNYRGSPALIAFSENTVHAWSANGTPKESFPRFINATLNGSPLLYRGNIIGGAADGYLYAVGGQPLFPDTVNIYSNRPETEGLEAIYVSNSALAGTPSVHTLTVQTGNSITEQDTTATGGKPAPSTVSESMFLTMSSNGSVFLINEQGELRLTRSMGQPAAQNFSPYITDINSDGLSEIIGLASFGRLYAWQVLDGERIYSLPTSGMQFPIVTDLDNDGNRELIAQTREGVRCWTIYDGQ
ncbi:MAG: hypothetical protein R3281_12340, partial [Balneolaceae bacterium]|nr:hypothetical protein [Balneolaceae bacterium]